MSEGLNTTDYKSFHYLENGAVEFSKINTNYTRPRLDVGIYDIESNHDGSKVVTSLKVSDDKEKFNQDISFYFEDKIDTIYHSFFNADIKAKINALGYNHKLGVLLYGKAGTGKTSMLKKYFKSIVRDHKGIVFNVTGFGYFTNTWSFIREIRKIQNNPIIIFIDEFEDLVDPNGNYKREDYFKKLSDGFDSIDNCFFMLATNYIDKIPNSIKHRPSRVKYCLEVTGVESEEKIYNFLADSFQKVGLDVDFAGEVKDLKGSTLDELKQFVLDKIMNISNENNREKRIGFNK